ncbi:hypothetical protein CRE_05844 [Caenorhabditis remanei]|uniref:Uncharacterized protein n=1 Tax=Caenorhabditis remanei TaxID=31234 RepID=E3MNN6_CAERE|nr:hypothetical protein CRE_05844 [Caenorhabditis remanei]
MSSAVVPNEPRQYLSCSICEKLTTDFNYGVVCCNACKMFYRRVLEKPAIITPKAINGCGGCGMKTCKYCRFWKCLKAGMQPASTVRPQTPPENPKINLDALLGYMHTLNTHRENTLTSDYYPEGHTMQELAELVGPINFVKKPKYIKMGVAEWGFLTALTTIDYLKKFDFMNLLSLEDRTNLLKNGYFLFSVFTTAHSSIDKLGQSHMSFPDGTDPVHSGLIENGGELEQRIRNRLVGRILELQVTKEEFLLLSMVFFCNPTHPDLSEPGITIINTSQVFYSSALFQYCQNHYQQNGPTRFADLLSLVHVIYKTFDDMMYHHITLSVQFPSLACKTCF